VLPVPPLVELTAPLVLLKTPAAAPVMFTDTVQADAAAMDPPEKLMLPAPAVAVAVPPQLLTSPFGVATVKPAGNVSVNATPAAATGFAAGLVIVKVSVETPFTAIAVGLNAFAMEGGPTTVTVALAVPPIPPSAEVMCPVVLF
jgi:hypothetical protein